MRKGKRILNILLCGFAVLLCVSAFQVVHIWGGLRKEEEEFAALSASRWEYQEETASAAGPEETGMWGKYQALYQKNPDLAGWISIEGTKVDYPVMFTPDEPEYYLYRSFDKEASVSGVPFIGEGSSAGSANVMIYGHNMKNGTMFAALLEYADKSFWKTHPVVRFDQLYQENTYEVMGAFYSKAYQPEEEGVFRFYEYVDLSTPERFDEYCSRVKEASLYDTGTEAEYGDQLLTLSTCSYHTKDGRFVVVARKTDRE